MVKHLRRLFLFIFALLLFPISAEAQTASTVTISQPNTDEFPLISAYLKAFDGQGNFIHQLSAGDVSIVEDRVTLQVNQLEKLSNGAQFVFAINLSPTFAIRDANAISRYDNIRAALLEWAGSQPADQLDDLSLLTNDAGDFAHLLSARAWLASLESYQSDARIAIPSLDVLARAIQIAADPASRPGMGRGVLLLTPPPERDTIGALQSLTSLAIQNDVRIYVWMVSAPSYFTTEGAQQLADMAEQTGGEYFAYSGEESFPDIEDYIDPLRYIYTLTYDSQIKTADPHTLVARISSRGINVSSGTQTFELEVLPPNPIFLSPPAQIVRANRADFEEALSNTSDYIPKNQGIEILIEFPDGRQRPLVRTTLYVDGQIADENTEPPFDRFTWDLGDYTQSASHQLQVEALDSLGLSGISIETSIQITVQQTPQSVVASIAKNGALIAGVVAAIAGSVLLLVLIVGGRIRPRAFGRLERSERRKKKAAKKDPVTQPVPVKPVASQRRWSGWVNRLSWPQRRQDPKAPAYLEPAEASNGFDPDAKISILSTELTFGREPSQATVAINDPSVDDLHARLRKDEDGNFRLFDQDSNAGTWVNFKPTVKEGTKLEHGDIIHVGRVEFRFKISDTKQIPKPIVTPLELER